MGCALYIQFTPWLVRKNVWGYDLQQKFFFSKLTNYIFIVNRVVVDYNKDPVHPILFLIPIPLACWRQFLHALGFF